MWLLEEKPLLECLKTSFYVLVSPNLNICDKIDVPLFFFPGDDLQNQIEEKVIPWAALFERLFRFLLSFYQEKELEKITRKESRPKERLKFRTSEEYTECKKFVIEHEDAFDFKKIAIILLFSAVRAKKSGGLEKAAKILKKCKKIIDFFRKFELAVDPEDDSFLTKPYKDEDFKRIEVIYKILFVQNEVCCQRYPQKSTIQLLNYAISTNNLWLEIEASCSFMDQLVALNYCQQAFDFAMKIFEGRIPEVGLTRLDFSDEKRLEFWQTKFFNQYLQGKFEDSTEKAEQYIEEQMEIYANSDKSQNSSSFALRIIGFFFFFHILF